MMQGITMQSAMFASEGREADELDWREQRACLLRLTPRAWVVQPVGLPSVITVNREAFPQSLSYAPRDGLRMASCHAQLMSWNAQSKGSFQGIVTLRLEEDSDTREQGARATQLCSPPHNALVSKTIPVRRRLQRM
jgi:hypothetical protein